MGIRRGGLGEGYLRYFTSLPKKNGKPKEKKLVLGTTGYRVPRDSPE